MKKTRESTEGSDREHLNSDPPSAGSSREATVTQEMGKDSEVRTEQEAESLGFWRPLAFISSMRRIWEGLSIEITYFLNS